ncbi:methyltransferase [Streptomyces sp. NPDC059002]|uniref:methyltransferase n=1 Tax=Streptomyces sp. NPDC059002 TaxID=3346690 RepID=UPI0036B7717E
MAQRVPRPRTRTESIPVPSPPVPSAALDPADLALIRAASSWGRGRDTDGVLAELVPALTAGERASLAAHCTPAHVAELVFPPSLDALTAGLDAEGLDVGDRVPSAVVRARLCERYGVPEPSLDVTIHHARLPAADGGPRTVEVFALEVPPGSALQEIAARERAERNESHVALDVGASDAVVLSGLCALLGGQGGLVPDGGGYNRHEDCTVLYFGTTEPAPAAARPRYRRLELRVPGHHPLTLAAHRAATPDPAKRLLDLMTGAWTTQAIAVAAEFELIDQLPAAGETAGLLPVAEVAARIGADPGGLARLLRFLAAAGLVTPAEGTYAAEGTYTSEGTYTATELGDLLRRDAHPSLRPLALLYGGLFYQSFGALSHSVRTGQEAFAALFGKGHFDYFAEHPALARQFDSAMFASAAMFEPIPGLFDFTRAPVVVDVGGGDGELLGGILARVPQARGVLFERADVLEAARRRSARADWADRCEFVEGDFTETVPKGGDVYVLARVLHDWDDERALTVLRGCAASMTAGASLLVVERLLPTDGSASLAVSWDLHMLCNVGGRERTAEEYEGLLSAAGFDLVSVADLPLDGSLLCARRRDDDPGQCR